MSAVRRWLRSLPLVATLATAPVAAGYAQAPAPGPTVSAASVGARRATAPLPAGEQRELVMQARRGHGQAAALMIVGAAAVVVGALAGGPAGPVLLLGGTAVGLYGLYLYLR